MIVAVSVSISDLVIVISSDPVMRPPERLRECETLPAERVSVAVAVTSFDPVPVPLSEAVTVVVVSFPPVKLGVIVCSLVPVTSLIVVDNVCDKVIDSVTRPL